MKLLREMRERAEGWRLARDLARSDRYDLTVSPVYSHAFDRGLFGLPTDVESWEVYALLPGTEARFVAHYHTTGRDGLSFSIVNSDELAEGLVHQLESLAKKHGADVDIEYYEKAASSFKNPLAEVR